jgi:hypothetical protein
MCGFGSGHPTFSTLCAPSTSGLRCCRR